MLPDGGHHTAVQFIIGTIKSKFQWSRSLRVYSLCNVSPHAMSFSRLKRWECPSLVNAQIARNSGIYSIGSHMQIVWIITDSHFNSHCPLIIIFIRLRTMKCRTWTGHHDLIWFWSSGHGSSHHLFTGVPRFLPMGPALENRAWSG